MRNVLAIDASNFLKRAFHTPGIMSEQKTPAQVARMTARAVDDYEADELWFVEDHPSPSYHYDLFPDYKKKRRENPSLPTSGELTEYVRPFLHEWGILTVSSCEWVERDGTLVERGHEADSVLASLARLCREAGHTLTIISRDKDLLALVGPFVRVVYPNGAGGALVLEHPEQVRDTAGLLAKKSLGVLPEQVLEWKILAGDDSDDIPSVGIDKLCTDGKTRHYGFTPQRAAELLREHGTLEQIYKHSPLLPRKEFDWLKACRDTHVPLMRRLLTLDDAIDLSHIDRSRADIAHLRLPEAPAP